MANFKLKQKRGKELGKKQPVRYWDCLYYDGCLDVAAHNGNKMSCEDCGLYAKDTEFRETDLTGYILLLREIFADDPVFKMYESRSGLQLDSWKSDFYELET